MNGPDAEHETRERMRAERVTVIVWMFRCYGSEATADMIRAFGEATNGIPQHLFAPAVKRAVADYRGNWRPGPGHIIEAAVQLEPAAVNPGQARGLPKWARKMRGERVREEQPRELGARSGEPGGAISLSDCVGMAVDLIGGKR